MIEHVLSIRKVEIDNAVAEAVFLVFGGLREAAVALEMSVQGVRNTLVEGQVRTGKNALRWEEATEKAGCKIPREELIGWAEWRGPERHDIGDQRRVGKGSARSASPKVADIGRPVEAGAPAASLSRKKGPGRPRKTGCFAQSDAQSVANELTELEDIAA